MKISLNWIFDHIKGGLQQVDIVQLVDRFIKTTAEIEGWEKVVFNKNTVTLVSVTSIGVDGIIVHCPEFEQEYVVPLRADAVIGSWYVMALGQGCLLWATAITFGGEKDALLPRVTVDKHLQAGGWKDCVEQEDYIITIDNKSINHRPDLWGHRGIAREIAAIFNLQLRPLDEFVVQKKIIAEELHAAQTATTHFATTIQSTDVCKRFATLYIDGLQSAPSTIAIVVRLSRLDSRSIDLLVDITNTVMLDLGQPMHAFDAHTLTNNNIIVRRAHAQEKIALLDGETVTLTQEDIVIADGDKAVSLAGIMGGATSAITAKTTAVLLESASFDATTVRRSAAHHRKRTEASARFEKSLDPYQNIDAITRFLFLLDAARISYNAADAIVSLGSCGQERVIAIEHAFIQARLGMEIESQRIISILEKLFFSVSQTTENNKIVYTIIVPSFRATKDISIPEDIVEEVGRFIGYDTIPRVMPSLPLVPSDLHKTYCTRAIKKFLSYGIMMRELYGYSFFDESFLREIAWEPNNFVAIKNPISANYTRLVTTLQPHLLKAVSENSVHHEALRFFEWGRTWHMEQEVIIEKKSVSGIFFDQDKKMDFYVGKDLLTRLFDQMHVVVKWQKNDNDLFSYPWLLQHQTAVLMHNDSVIGVAGMVDDAAMQLICPAAASAFIFELDGDYLIEFQRPLIRCAPVSKYPAVLRDVSMLVSLFVTVDHITDLIRKVDERIVAVTLIDFFTKPEWENQKALTFHVEIRDAQKTLEHDDVEKIWSKVIAQLHEQGAVIR